MGTVHAKDTPPEIPLKTPVTNSPTNVFGIDSNEPVFGSGNHPCDSKRRLDTKVVDLKGIEARVDRVSVEGLNRTKDDIIDKTVKDLFQAENFEDMLKKANNVRTKLQKLGCFRNIQIHIDTSDGPGATPNGYEVTYQVNELRRVSGGVTTHVCNDEGVLAVAMQLPNIWGRGENLKGEYTYGSRRSKTFNLSLVKPWINSWNSIGTATIFQNEAEFPVSGYKVTGRGVLLDLEFITKSVFKHNLQWEGNWRELGVGNRYASFEVREDAGNSLKSSLHHLVTYDARDNPIFPTCGSLWRLCTELAGLGGNVGFFKNELNVQGNWALSKDFILQLSWNTGHMMLLNDDKQPLVCDNFFLGGPLSFRGFELRGMGPQSDGNFTGSKFYWSSGVHIYSPLPFKPGSGGFGDLFRSHLFLNAGNLGDLKLDSVKEFIDDQIETMRMSWGIGLALRLGQMARVELNYVMPFLFNDADARVNGLQFGIGCHFL